MPAAVPYFTGRAAELETLTRLADRAVTGGESVMITAISGTAGVGKTALALHWAHQAADRFPDGQLYVNLRGYDPSGVPVQPYEAVLGFLEALGVPAGQLPHDAQARTGLYRSLMAGRRMLIVLDNARDAAQVRPLLPGAPGSLVLVTSRSQMAGLAAADGAHLVTVGLLSEDQARRLLTARLDGPRVTDEPGAVRALITLCARLPLALNIVAARAAARPDLPLAALTTALRSQPALLDVLDTGDPASSARTVFSWSYQNLTEPAAAMFRLLGLHPGPDITAAAAASLAGLPAGQASRVLLELTAAHLLAEHLPGRFAFHDLLRAYAAEQAGSDDSESTQRAALDRVLSHYANAAQAAAALMCPGRDLLALAPSASGVTPEEHDNGTAALAWFTAERQVLSACVNCAADNGLSAHAWRLGWLLGRYLHRRGAWQEWAAILQIALAAARRAADLPGQAYAHRDLGAAYSSLSSRQDDRQHLQHAMSLQHLQQAMSIYQQLGDIVGQAHVHLYIGRLLEVQNRVREMLPHQLRALQLFRSAEHAAGQANALSNAAVCYRELGDHARAVDCCEQALELHGRAGNRDGEGHTWKCLGYIHQRLGQQDRAIACDRRSVALFRELGDRPLLAEALTQLGDSLHAFGNEHTAHAVWQEALSILDDQHHPDATKVRARLPPTSSSG